MGLADFERRLERGVEGFFGRVFRSDIRPVELGRKLIREMDGARTVGVDGRLLAPNHFVVTLAPSDAEAMTEMGEALRRELGELARSHAVEEGYSLSGPISVEIEADGGVRAGVVEVDGHFREPPPGSERCCLVLPDGQRVPLGDYVVTIGRNDDNTIVLEDPNASRRHAEVRPGDHDFVVVDLGSTNGIKVNGTPVSRHQLVHGDRIGLGATVLGYEKT